ncbi:MAG: hypothetical protein IKR52_08900 [Paludibacteraceae bacterium]|nr:hypothetical protein [Paludibacteraceae bacterium]
MGNEIAIFREVKDKTGVQSGEIISRSRTWRIHRARILFCQLCRLQGYTTTEIGVMIQRNHATVLNMLKKYDDLSKFGQLGYKIVKL